MTLIYNFQVASDWLRAIALVDDIKICTTRQHSSHYTYPSVRLAVKVSSVVIIAFCLIDHCTSSIKNLHHVRREAFNTVDVENIILAIVVSRHAVEWMDFGLYLEGLCGLTTQG